jgi:hypothetical protein
MRLFGRTLTVAIVGALTVFASLAMAAKFNEADVTLTLGQKATGKSTSMKLAMKISGKGQDKSPNQLEITLPKGAEIDTGAPGTCPAAASSPTTCPNASKIGDGSANFFSTNYDLTITNMDDGSIKIWAKLGTDSYLPFDATVNGRTITSEILGFSKVSLTLDEVTDGDSAFLRTPAKCPTSNKWTSTVKTTYYNGGMDPIVETDKPKTPCK